MANRERYGAYSVEFTPESFPVELQEVRKSGREAFLESGFPTTRTEQWRATNIKEIRETEYTLAQRTDIQEVAPLPSVEQGQCIVAVNGAIASDAAYKSRDGLIVTTLSETPNSFPKELIGSVENSKGHSFYHLNSALFTDALSISVDKSFGHSEPLEVQYYGTAQNEAALASNRTVVEVRSGASLHFIQHFLSEGENSLLSNSVTEIILHKGARFHHTIVQDESEKSNHVHSIFVHQQDESNYEALSLAPGSQFSRTDFQVFLKGEKAHADLKGLFVGSHRRVHNGDITIHHDAKDCTSSTLFKGIGGDSSHGIFRGLVHVSENGQGTDAKQSYKTLLLTDDARVTTEPHLLIYNDDVACSHGATVGQLDEKQLFYLESRGLEPVTAKKILIQSFAAEVVSSIENEALKETLLERVHDEVAHVSSNAGGA